MDRSVAGQEPRFAGLARLARSSGSSAMVGRTHQPHNEQVVNTHTDTFVVIATVADPGSRLHLGWGNLISCDTPEKQSCYPRSELLRL